MVQGTEYKCAGLFSLNIFNCLNQIEGVKTLSQVNKKLDITYAHNGRDAMVGQGSKQECEDRLGCRCCCRILWHCTATTTHSALLQVYCALWVVDAHCSVHSTVVGSGCTVHCGCTALLQEGSAGGCWPRISPTPAS